MSLWNDFWDFVDDTVHDVGDTLSDAWHAVKDNPIGTITSAVAMAYGIPPMWAGALGGAAGAAATGGNIIKAAVTGGAMGYMGGAAGAAAGEAGALAQAAAAGAAASATGAILTGQDVLTAAKQGLILGSTVYGGQKLYQLMTPQEAVASVPPETLAKLTSTSSDPLGDLIDKMGWTSSDSATAAASEAFSKNAATTQQMLQESIPEYVLKAASQSSMPGEYIANELGWNNNNLTIGAANKAATQYITQQNAIEAATKAEAAKPENIFKSAGADAESAKALAEITGNTYDAANVKSLLDKGYTASELLDMHGAGVSFSTLNNLKTDVFTPDQINSMLQHGASINDITGVSLNASRFGLDSQQLENFVNKGADAQDLSSWKVNGKLDAAAKLLNNGVSASDIHSLTSNGWDINKLASQVENNFISGEDINNTLRNNYTRQGINDLLNDTTRLPNADEIAAQRAAEVQAQQQAAEQARLQEQFQAAAKTQQQAAQQLADQSGGYLTAQQVLDEHLTLEDVQHYRDYMDQLHANQTTQQPTQPVEPNQTVDVSNMTQEQLNQALGENNPYLETSNGTQTASYTAEQEAMYNQLRSQGYSAQQATDMITNGSVSDAGSYHVDVGGSPVYSDVAGSGLKGAIPEGYELAPSTDLNGASYNAEINAYIRPVQAPTPVVPVIVPPTTTPTTTPTQTTPVAPVTGTPTSTASQPTTNTGSASNVGGSTTPQPISGPTVETDSQGNMWYVTPMSDGTFQRDLAWQSPTSSQPVTQPSQPTQPVAVSSSTRTTYDGSVYRDTQMSDGSTTSVLISGPTGTGTGTGTGTTTQPPLSEPKQEVIPPGSSYVAPVETGTTTPPVNTTTPPVDTTIVPIIPPTGQTPEVPPETRGHYTLGEPIHPAIPNALNPGWITNVPQHYQTTNDAQSQYYWGAHPYQTGTTFNPTLYNQVPNAPQQAWGVGHAQTAATPQQIMSAMNQVYPLLNSVNGPVQPSFH